MKMNYLFIYEDGNCSAEDEFTAQDADSVDAGILEVIKFQDGDFYTYSQCGDGDWHKINSICEV